MPRNPVKSGGVHLNSTNGGVECGNDGQTVLAVYETFWALNAVSAGISRNRLSSEITITSTSVVGRPTDEERASYGRCFRR